MRIVAIFLTVYLFSFALEISHCQSLDQLQKYIATLPLQKKIELDMISALKSGNKEDAKFLLKLLQPVTKGDKLENLLYHPNSFSAVIVNKSQQRLKLIYNEDNGTNMLDLPCITGKRQGDKLLSGDKKTPSGVYFGLWFIPQEKLSAIYGIGAFPLNYPNIIDKKLYHKTGNGIWIHATNNDHRPPFSSNGCVVLTNENFQRLKPHFKPRHTPVIIVEDYSYVPAKELEKTRRSLGYFIYRWKKAWEKSVHGRYKEYINFYSSHMIWPKGDYKDFIRYKRSVAQAKKWIKIKMKNLYLTKDGRVLDYGHIYVAIMDMEYDSNNYHWQGKKILYIIKDKNRWKILAEENL